MGDPHFLKSIPFMAMGSCSRLPSLWEVVLFLEMAPIPIICRVSVVIFSSVFPPSPLGLVGERCVILVFSNISLYAP